LKSSSCLAANIVMVSPYLQHTATRLACSPACLAAVIDQHTVYNVGLQRTPSFFSYLENVVHIT